MANNRTSLSNFTKSLQFKEFKLKLPTSLTIIVTFIFLIVFWRNLVTLNKFPIKENKVFHNIATILGMDQKWRMFANVLKSDGWRVIVGRLKNGEHFNLLSPDIPIPYTPPKNYSDLYVNHRKRKYLFHIFT